MIEFIIYFLLKVMNISIDFIWHRVLEMIDIPFYTTIVAGLVIGIWKKIY